MTRATPLVLAVFLASLASLAVAAPSPYRPADQGQRPPSGTKLLPEQFLRGFDPVTVYFPSSQVKGPGPADNGDKLLRIVPAWPGAWSWVDDRTLQFRPGEPWPALARFSVEAAGDRKILTTLMAAPQGMSPQAGAEELRPFRAVTLTFPQALALPALKQMLSLELRDLPGLGDSPRKKVKGWTMAELPRGNARDPASYALTLDEEVPEGKVLLVQVSLALGDEDRVLWTGRAATRRPFHLESITCGQATFPLQGDGKVPRDTALACGSAGETPALVFSAPLGQDVSLTEVKKLVRLEPSVPDLHTETYGSRLMLKGRFVPDTLYRIKLGAAALKDDAGRALQAPGEAEAFFYLGWRSAFLRWSQSTAVLEANGPRLLPLVGYGDARADVRIYRIDPLFNGLWPFPQTPITVNEESAPPFPGEEPGTPTVASHGLDSAELAKHLRLLGSPLVSRLVDLPLDKHGQATRFGLDLGALLDASVGKAKPGTYLVGVRRLQGPPERSFVRVQVTNLSLTVVEERPRAVFFIRTLDTAEPVRGAVITLEGMGGNGKPISVQATTDGAGRAELEPVHGWSQVTRLSVKSGDDSLVLDPSEAPPHFASNHWGMSDQWLSWLMSTPPAPANNQLLGFLFTERPIYKPGESVFLKGYARRKDTGQLVQPGLSSDFVMRVDGPGGKSWDLPVNFTALDGFGGTFSDDDAPTGQYTASLVYKPGGNAIATRTFQIEAYRIPTFEVRLSAPPVVPLDRPFTVKAVARYYAGGNVAQQPIKWTVTQRPYHHIPAGREGFLFASSTQFARPSADKAMEPITRQATLNDEGADSLALNPALDIDGSARIYTLETTVTGPDDQPISGTLNVTALPPFVLGLKVPRYLEKATALNPQVIAVGVDDQLVKGQEVTLKLFKRVWHSHLRETNFSKGEAQYVTEQEDVKLKELTFTTDDKASGPSLPLTEAGVYVVDVSARDKLGRVQSLSADLYVGGQGPVSWQKAREGVFDVSPDKRSYKPGDTARIVIQSPFQKGTALVVVESPHGNQYAWVEVEGGKGVYSLPVLAEWTPNLPVHVVLMRGRLGDPLASPKEVAVKDDARFKPQTLASSIQLRVEPVKNQLDVGLKFPDTARPGQTVDVTVSISDDQQHGVPGEVTLWLVDEAVLSLAKEAPLDPLEHFVTENSATSTIRDTRNTVLGRILEQEEPGGDGDTNKDDDGSGAHVVRKNFKTVPYYAETLQVPASGRLTVKVKLSDDLTNFKVRAVAVSSLKRFGFEQATLHVRIPVLIQPQLPRFVRQGDSFLAGGIARLLEGSGGAGVVTVNVKGPADTKGGTLPITLKENGAATARVPVKAMSTASDQPSQLTFRVSVTRKSDGAGDAFEVQLPVLPDRVYEHAAFLQAMAAGPLAFPPFPEAPRPGTGSVRLTVSNVPGALEVAGALDYLGGYPHGCLEQQMSQLSPEVAARFLFEKLGFSSQHSAQNALHVKKLVTDLPTYQDERGLLGYWPGSTGDVQLTAQLVAFQADVKKAGLPIDEKVQAKAIAALQKVLRSDYPGLLREYRYDQEVAALAALTRVGHLDQHYLIDLFQNRKAMDVSSEAWLALAMGTDPKLFGANLEAIKGDLWDSVVLQLKDGKSRFVGMNWRRTYWDGSYLGGNASTVADVLAALVLLDGKDPRLTQLRDGLLTFATPERAWGNTYANRRAILALATYLELAEEPSPEATLSITGASPLTLGAKLKVAQLSLKSDAPPTGSLTGAARTRVDYRFLPAATGDQVKAVKQGFIVTRSTTRYPAAGGAAENAADEAGAVRKLQVGDVLELHTRFVTEQARYQVAVVVPFAAGCEPLNPELATASSDAKPSESDTIQATYVQRLDHEVRYYFNQLPAGSHALHFRVRASSEGSYVHPAPYAELMYDEAVRGRGEGERFTIEAAAK
jgi:hypothetical protein